MQTKGFLFDVDGVLYDSIPQHAKACVQAFSEYRLTVPERLLSVRRDDRGRLSERSVWIFMPAHRRNA